MTEWNAPEYTKVAGLQNLMAAEALSLLQLNGAERVLDLGCGNGKVTAAIGARLPTGSILGVDSSADMIAFASQNFGDRSNVKFQQHDIRSLPFKEEFDLVVSFNALHWIPDQENALQCIKSAMKPNSIAQLRLVPDGLRKSLETVIEEVRLSPRWAGNFQGFCDPYLHLTQEQYAALVTRNGLHVLQIQVHDRAGDFKSRSAFQAFGSVTFIEWTKCLPVEDRPFFVDDVLDRYHREVTNAPGEENTFRFYQMDVTLSYG
jgi:trans-aconitate 2-methyltransferase